MTQLTFLPNTLKCGKDEAAKLIYYLNPHWGQQLKTPVPFLVLLKAA